MEPDEVACIFESAAAADGQPHASTGSGKTIMAGLNCGEPCLITWPILRDFADYYFACPDSVSARGMRVLAAPMPGDTPIISGESGSVTTGLLSLLTMKKSLEPFREQLGLNEDSVVLVFNTEGNTDPAGFLDVVYDGAHPMA